MTDWLSREQRSRNMASIRSQGNASTETAFLRLLRQAGIHGWRRHAGLPGKPDFVFRAERVAVFIDGCFWHGCPRCYRMPGDNRRYWKAKLLSNRRRDRRSSRKLRSLGWRVVRIWEHSLKSGRAQAFAVARIGKALQTGSGRETGCGCTHGPTAGLPGTARARQPNAPVANADLSQSARRASDLPACASIDSSGQFGRPRGLRRLGADG